VAGRRGSNLMLATTVFDAVGVALCTLALVAIVALVRRG